MNDGLYSSANARGLPPSAETVYGAVSAPMPGAPLLEEEGLPPQEVPASGGLLRSSAIMAVGTLASRLTGFLRTVLILAALGSERLGDAFNTANTVPNQVYDILLGGVLTAAHVPLLIRARQKSEKYGEEYEQRLFTALLGALAAITVLAMLAAPLLIDLNAKKFTPAQHDVARLFLLFFLPQVFFYGFSAVASASLNSRNRFAAAMWTPVLNNIVVIAVTAIFMATTHNLTIDNISHGQITFLGIGVTAGVAAQALGLIPALKRMGFNFRPRFDFRRSELTEMWGVASWTLLYVLAQQVAFTVYNNLANAAGGKSAGAGSTPWQTAYAFFQLPYAVVAISIITAVFPRMTESAAQGRFDRLLAQLRESLTLSMSLMLPAIALLFGAASEICLVVFAHGNTSASNAEVIANVLRVFAIALLPFSVLQLLQRGFYAQQDTRTPALISIASTGSGIVAALVLSNILPTRHVVLGIAGSQGLAWTIGCLVSIVVLRKRFGRIGGGEIVSSFLRTAIAALATLAVAEIVHLVVVPHLDGSKTLSALMLVLDGLLGGGVFLIFAIVLRVREVSQVIGMLRSKLGR